MTLSSGTTLKRKAGWKTVDWRPEASNVRVPLLPNSYIDREVLATKELVALTTTIEAKNGEDRS
jgi:hypothetical protein